MAQVARAQHEQGAVLSLPQLPSSFSDRLCILSLLELHLSNAPLIRRSEQSISLWM